MDVLITTIPLQEFIVDVHSAFVVAIMEGTVSDSQISFQILTVRILSVTLQQGESGNEVTFLEEVLGFRELGSVLHFLLDSCGWRLLLTLDC